MLLGYAHALPTGLLVRERGQYLYVTSGIGTSGVPLRWRVPPEFVVLDVTGPSYAAVSTVGAATGCLSASTL
jgi:predicted MPP superfamily phosphohydrolase